MIQEIKMFDRVLLKDGRKADIMEVFIQGKAYLADIEIEEDPGEYDIMVDITQDDIEKVISIST